MTVADGQLKLSHDRKVSPRGTYQGVWTDSRGRSRRPRWIPKVGNSFGLPSGVSCPGKTEFCVSCYAANLELGWPQVGALTDHNLHLLLDAGTTDAMTDLLMEMMGRYWAEVVAKDLDEKETLFRIHWDGDFFSVDYAEAWARTIRAFPAVRFWLYTRSFRPPVDVVPQLVGLPNLALYLSADRHNIDDALAQCEQHPELLLALCDVDYVSARALAPERRSLVCPENAEKIPLMAGGVGACVSCRLCPDGKRDVLFSTTHKEHRTDQQTLPGVPIEVWLDAPVRKRTGLPLERRIGGSQNIPDGPKAGPDDVACAWPPCNNRIDRSAGRGRPRLYCCNAHRAQMAYDKQRGITHEEAPREEPSVVVTDPGPTALSML